MNQGVSAATAASRACTPLSRPACRDIRQHSAARIVTGRAMEPQQPSTPPATLPPILDHRSPPQSAKSRGEGDEQGASKAHTCLGCGGSSPDRLVRIPPLATLCSGRYRARRSRTGSTLRAPSPGYLARRGNECVRPGAYTTGGWRDIEPDRLSALRHIVKG